jgi:proline dehydrogenase
LIVDAITRSTFSMLAGSGLLRKAASRYGLRHPNSFARRFVAGEHLEDAIGAAVALERHGLQVTLDLLGESVSTMEPALAATAAYVDLIRAASAAGISRNISVKLTQIGLVIDRASAIDNLRRILHVAAAEDFFVRVDMESSEHTDDTIEALESVWGIGVRNLGAVIQSALRRSTADVHKLNTLGMRVRLVKGAYHEPRDVAFQRKEEVDAHYVSLMELLLTEGNYPAIATHDPVLIERAKAFAASHGIARDRFEFQMLFGIRRDLQLALVRDGYTVRIYVPYGREWFPYFMRRLGERPANVGFVLRNLFAEERMA